MMWSTLMHHLQLVLCRWVFNDKTGGDDLVKIRYKYVPPNNTGTLKWIRLVTGDYCN